MTDKNPAPRADFCQFVLPVADLGRSVAFYGETLGLTELRAEAAGEDRWFAWTNGIVLVLHPLAEGSGEIFPPLDLVVRVDDLGAVQERLVEARALDRWAEEGHLLALDPDRNRLRILEGRGLAPGMVSRSRLADGQLVIEEEIRVAGDPETVWSAFMDPAILSAWLCGGPAEIDPVTGGRLRLTFPHIGRKHTTWNCEMRDCVPSARFRFEEVELGIEVTIDLAPDPQGGTLLRLTQTPFDLSGVDAPERAAQNLALIWRRILRRLSLFLEDELEPGEIPEDESS